MDRIKQKLDMPEKDFEKVGSFSTSILELVHDK